MNAAYQIEAAPPRTVAPATGMMLVLLGAHAVLAVLMDRSRLAADFQAYGAMAAGMYLVLTRASVLRIACAAAYIAGSEVLWRMTETTVFDQSAKYAIALMLGLAVFRTRDWRLDGKAVLYLVLLLPSCLLTLFALDGMDARKALSFNMSGPLALAACVSFFANVRLERHEILRICYWFVAPVFGVAALAWMGVRSASGLQGVRGSSILGSGGFGPNQVSAALGLAAFLAFFWLIGERGSLGKRLVLGALAGAFAAQSALTFSRSGLYCASGAAFVASIYYFRAGRNRATLLAFGGLIALAGAQFVLPNLDRLTGGGVSRRFQDTDLTHRGDLGRADIRIWRDHPLFGVGPGAGRALRREYVNVAADPHTEYTRLLAEHGLFGLAALLVLAAMAASLFRKARGDFGRAMTASFIVWGALFMATSAMRLSAPALMIGLAAAQTFEAARSRGGRRPAEYDWQSAGTFDRTHIWAPHVAR